MPRNPDLRSALSEGLLQDAAPRSARFGGKAVLLLSLLLGLAYVAFLSSTASLGESKSAITMALQIPFAKLTRTQEVAKARPLAQPATGWSRKSRGFAAFAVPEGELDDGGLAAKFNRFVQNDIPDGEGMSLFREFKQVVGAAGGAAMLDRTAAKQPGESEMKVSLEKPSSCCKAPLLHYSGLRGHGKWCIDCGSRQNTGIFQESDREVSDRELHGLIDSFFEQPDAEAQSLHELYTSLATSLGGFSDELRQRTRTYAAQVIQDRRNAPRSSLS